MAGRLGHIDGTRRVGHVPRNGISSFFNAYGFACEFWLDAGFGTDTTTDLDPVSEWRARTGQIFTQTTLAQKPIFYEAEAQFNNLPTVKSTTTTSYMQTVTPITTSHGTRTLVMVANYDTPNAGNAVLGNSSGNQNIVIAGTNASISGQGFSDGLTFSEFGTTEVSTPRIYVQTGSYLMVNKSVEKTFTRNLESTFNRLFYVQGVSYNLRGSIAEIIVFKSNFTQAQSQYVTDILNAKYAIY